MKPLLIFIIIVIPFFLFAQENKTKNQVSIEGTIVTADGRPAANVSILLKNSISGTVADENGNFKIPKIKPGQYILHISLLGYSDQEIGVTVKQNESVSLKIQLKQTYAELTNIILETSKQSKYVETKISEGL